MTKAAVYNRFWHSRGGGERHAGMIAQTLSQDPELEVELIGHSAEDLPALSAHLGLNLSRCRYRQIPDRGDDSLSRLSARYDLWVTASYMSRLTPRATRSAYLCFFPTPFDHDMLRWRRQAIRAFGPLLRGYEGAIGAGLGWFPAEGGRRRKWMWSSGDATIVVPPGPRRQLGADFGRPGAGASTELTLTDNADFRTTLIVNPSFQRKSVTLPASTDGFELRFLSDAFQAGGPDVRSLGVAVSRLRLQGLKRSPRHYLANRFPWLLLDPADLSFLDSYDTILANSEYTRNWINTLWKRESDVLFPPIAVERLHPKPEREKVILTVGRFFAPGLGHAKRQLEMVQWFGDLYRSGRLPGWRMHLIGGCEKSQLSYLARIQQAAAGLPITVTPNAPHSTVEELLCTSSIFWAATGWGERANTPWAVEHFGMTTVEAMAGGCVPVVIDLGGQREIVRENINGFRWQNIQQLNDQTVAVANDPALRTRLSEAAVEWASAFSESAFEQRWKAIVDQRKLLER